jgi:hypothetical protein
MSEFLYPVPDEPPADGDQITVSFGKKWLAIILDRVDDLLSEQAWLAPPDDISQQVEELLDLLSTDIPPVTVYYPHFAQIFHHAALVVVGNPIVVNVDPLQIYNFTARQTAEAINDTFQNVVTLAAGTYTLTVVCAKTSASGIITWYLDENLIGTTDLYNAATVRNVELQVSGIDIETGGLHQLTGEVGSKNASSSSYRAPLTAYYLTKT